MLPCVNENWFRSNLILELLYRIGMTNVVISPGSRNTPLSHCAIHHPHLTTTVHIDERGAGFFALGISKASHQPCGLICTSGTATANYFPAIVEAYSSEIPLFILTADRPNRLQNVGAPQTIRQIRMYGIYTPLFVSVPESLRNEQDADLWIQSFLTKYQSTYKYYPIHLNIPFDEPLIPLSTFPSEEIEQKNQFVKSIDERYQKLFLRNQNNIPTLSGCLEFPIKAERFILVGPMAIRNSADRAVFSKIMDSIQAPVFSDVTSGVPNHPYVVEYGDLVLRTPYGKQLQPNLLLWFGKYPTSKALQDFIRRSQSVFHFTTDEKVVDPDHCVSLHFHCTYHQLLSLIAHTHQTSVSEKFWKIFPSIIKHIETILQNRHRELPIEIQFLRSLHLSIHQTTHIFVSNSMVMRWCDMFLPRSSFVTFYGNKGVNGIDGNLATTAGIAKATHQLTIGIIGDLAFLHDINSLLLLRNLPVVLFVLNNEGGGIFHLLPSYQTLREFDQLYHSKVNSFERIQGTAQNVSIQEICNGFRLPYLLLEPPFLEITSILNECYQQQTPIVVECRSNRYDSYSKFTQFLSILKTLGLE